MSPQDREERLKLARQQELSRIISELPEIEKGVVVYDTARQGRFGRDRVTTASVVVMPKAGQEIAPDLASSIRLLVVKAIAGLEPHNVAVTDGSTGYTTIGNSEDYGGPHNDEYIARKAHHEKQYQEKILRSLGYIPGVMVAADVKLNPEKMHREEEVKHDPKPVAVQSNETSVVESVESGAPAGPPGYSAQQNAPRRLAAASSGGTKEEREETQTNQYNALSSQVVKSERAPLTPERVSVAVSVPTAYYEDLWRKLNPAAEGEEPKAPAPTDLDPIRQAEMAKIKEVVASLIPLPADGTDAKTLVTVSDFQTIAPPSIPEPGLAQHALTWFAESWSTLGLLGLVGFSLLMLRSMVRSGSIPDDGPRAATARPRGAEQQEEVSDENPKQRKLKRFGSTGASLKDELAELVGEDPDSAANILRNWIGSAS